MDQEKAYVDYFYDTYKGRVSIGVGYNNQINEIFPLVYQTAKGNSIGVLALDVVEHDQKWVHIYHLGAFVTQQGDGSRILVELCLQADNFDVSLGVSPIVIPNGSGSQMGDLQLVEWYERYGFKGEAGLLRQPRAIETRQS